MSSQHMNKDDNEPKNERPVERDAAASNECMASLEICQKERNEWKEKYLYLRADFDNAQRRMAKDMERLVWEAQAKLLREIVDVVADFERALSSGQASSEQHGLMLIYKRLLKILDQAGVKEIEVSHDFDPALHEAVAHVNAPGHESGSIVEVLQKGYRFKHEVLRPARVSVAQ